MQIINHSFFLAWISTSATFSEALINWITLINFLMPNKIADITNKTLFKMMSPSGNPNCF